MKKWKINFFSKSTCRQGARIVLAKTEYEAKSKSSYSEIVLQVKPWDMSPFSSNEKFC